MSTQVVIKNVRLSYCYAVNGKKNKEGKHSWSATLLIPKNDSQLEKIRAGIEAAKAAGKEKGKLVKGAIKSPLLDGDAKEEDGSWKYGGDENRGHFLLRAASYTRAPKAVDQQRNAITDPEDLYSGVFANVVINFYPYRGETGQGISPGLEAVQKKRDGDRLSGGGVDVNTAFDVEDDDDGFLS
ncbi:MAG: ssDNA-binding protein [Steroidobacteraceae bacterium]